MRKGYRILLFVNAKEVVENFTKVVGMLSGASLKRALDRIFRGIMCVPIPSTYIILLLLPLVPN